ncbi:hypothetical protein ACLGAI_06125 [Helicobacter pylori]
MKQDKAERKRWSCCERVRRLIKLMSESFLPIHAIFSKRLSKQVMDCLIESLPLSIILMGQILSVFDEM